VSTAYTGFGILLGEDGVLSRSNHCVVKNCEFSNIGFGISTSGEGNIIENNRFTNFKNVGDTSGSFDYGAIPIILGTGKKYRVVKNYIKGGWAFSGATASGQGLNGAGIEIINDVDSSFIGYNTIVDCAGALEIGQNQGNPLIGANDDTIAYNKFINNNIICYTNTTGTFGTSTKKLRFWNNVYVENAKSRFSGPSHGTDVFGDGQSFSSFPSWPNFPKNPSVFNFSGRRILQYGTDNGNPLDTLYDIRNNVFWMNTKNQAVYDNSRVRSVRMNNIFRLTGEAVLGGTLKSGNFLEIITTDKLFTDTLSINPEAWDYKPNPVSPAINFGRNVGLTRDVNEVQIVGNPDAGVHEFAASVPLTATALLINPILCFGQNTTVNVSAVGGNPPYVGTGSFNVYGGTNTFTVRDASNQTASVDLTIPQPAAISANITSGRIIVLGGNTSITATASGGMMPYQYKLNNGSFSSTNQFVVLAGTHTITIKDANNCLFTTSITLKQPSALLASTVTADSSIRCNGGTTTIKVSASGGTAPYTGTGVFTVTAGTYNYLVYDSNGVSITKSITISQPTAITADVSAGTISTFGNTTTINISNVSNGTSPYVYALDGGAYQTSRSFSNVRGGSHTVYIRDSKPCTLAKNIVITEPASTLSASATATKILCNGGTSTVVVSATGGRSPYTGIGSFSVTSGSRTFVVTDAVGASKSIVLNITQPNPLSLGLTPGRIIVTGGNTTISALATGGTLPYQYKIDNGNYGSSTLFSNVLAGNHTVTVRDSNNCTQSASLTITQPASLLNTTVIADSSIRCFGGTTTVKVTATGGTAPYSGTGTFNRSTGTYNFTVADSNGVSLTKSITLSQPTQLIATASAGTITTFGGKTNITLSGVSGGTSPYSYSLNGGTAQTSTVFSNVGAGSYVVNIIDAKRCTISKTLTITQPVSNLSASVSATPILCFGGSSTLTVSATGGTPPYIGTGTFSVNPGTYNYTVVDAVGSSKTTSITINQPAALSLIASPTRIIQNGGTANVVLTATGGTASYTYRLNTGSYTSNSTFTGIAAGTSNFTVRDANGCLTTQTITITQPQVLLVSAVKTNIICKGTQSTVTVSATGGTPPYTGIGVFQKTAGTHSFVVLDSNGVSASTTVVVTEPALALAGTVTAGNITTANGTTSITVSGVSGGSSPYTFSLNGGTYQSSSSFSNVPSGTYIINIKDALGCILPKTITIAGVLRATILNFTNMSCLNRWDGTITVGAQNGRAPYSYRINNYGYGSNNVFRLLGAGTYTLYVKDANATVATTTQVISNSSVPCAARSMNTTDLKADLVEINPNPSNHYFMMRINTPERCTMAFLDAKGRKIENRSYQYQTETTFGEDWSQGVYFVQITTANGVFTKKLIKL
jgi:hypothetical protein